MRRFRLCLILLVIAACAFAHDPSISGFKIILDKAGAIVSVTTQRTNFGKENVAAEYAKQIHLVVNGHTWVCTDPQILEDKANNSITLQGKISEPVERVEVTERLFSDNQNSKTIVTVMKDGEAVGEGVLTSEFKSWTYGSMTKTSPRNVFFDFLAMGIGHILSGPDHILFILALMLARPRIKELLKVATAFTIAHSITLSLCALNIFTLSPRIVEPLIALSIVVVAFEKFAKPNDKVWRTILIAFAFGLIHGFGFAGALTEAGLPPNQAALSLAAFNIGVEVVQASLILVTVPILTLLSERVPKFYSPATKVLAAFIVLAGSFWFFERIVNGR